MYTMTKNYSFNLLIPGIIRVFDFTAYSICNVKKLGPSWAVRHMERCWSPFP